MSIKVQIASDIHLEFSKWNNRQNPKFECFITPHAPILVLAGDIGNPGAPPYRKFLEWCSSKFTYVFLTPGNHEYYGRSIEAGDSLLEEVCHSTGVILLNHRSFSIPSLSLTFIGTTMWSRIPQEAEYEVLMYISDFSKIKGMSVDVYNDLHDRSKEWLAGELTRVDPTHKKIVITHHSPMLEVTSHPVYRGKRTNYAFQSDCSDIMRDADIDTWFFGHTHYSVDLMGENNTRVVSNQHGYAGELYTTKYKKHKFVKFDVKNSLTVNQE